MDLDNIKQLKILTKGMSLLYIESDKTLQKQIKTNFNHFFINIYQAFDGEDGLRHFKTYKPDIIITTLTLSKIDGIEIIAEIKNQDDYTKIIVLCDDNEDLELLKTLEMDIIGILIKPLDIYKLINMLLKAVKIQSSKKEIQSFNDLKDIFNKKQSISLINFYKGIPVDNEAHIVKINEDELILKVLKIQLIAIKYEHNTVIRVNQSDKYIKSILLHLDQKNNLITLVKPQYFNYKKRDKENKRVLIDTSFKIGLRHHTKSILAKSLDVSFTSISMISDKPCDDYLQTDDEVDLTIGFKIKAKNSLIQTDLVTKVFAKGKIVRTAPYLTQTKIVLSIEIEKSSQSTFIKYLKQRELETILELRKLINT
jgi:DNA-binding response OmpR family regulator